MSTRRPPDVRVPDYDQRPTEDHVFNNLRANEDEGMGRAVPEIQTIAGVGYEGAWNATVPRLMHRGQCHLGWSVDGIPKREKPSGN